MPGWLTDAEIAREAATRTVRQVGYVTAYRAVRAPWDGLRLTWYAFGRWTPVGVAGGPLGVRRRRTPLIGEVTARDDRAYVRMAHDRTIRQKWRFSLLGVALLVLVAAVAAARVLAPHWVLPAALLLVVLGLARYGKPVGAKMLSPAVRKDVKILLTSQAIVRALSVLGIAH